MTTMMRLCLLVSLFATPVSAFAVLPPNRLLTGTTTSTAVSDDNSEAHLRENQGQVWSELKQKERDIIVQETLKGTDQEDLTKKLVTEMLETAIDFVQSKEMLEEERAAWAHQAYNKARKEEMVLEEVAHHESDASNADAILHSNQKHKFMEEVVEDAVPEKHIVEDYVEERLHRAQNEEVAAIEQEEEALRTLRDLKMTEDDFKATLAQLKQLEDSDDSVTI